MTATQKSPPRKVAAKSKKAKPRPVTETLLELAYMLHATKAIHLTRSGRPNRNRSR